MTDPKQVARPTRFSLLATDENNRTAPSPGERERRTRVPAMRLLDDGFFALARSPKSTGTAV